MRRPADAYWFRLKDRARRRAERLCEFCELRTGLQLHHRSYAREGREKMEDVMLVCRLCHRVIHGLVQGAEIAVAKGSLAALGDSGMGITPLWKWYLGRRRRRRVAR